LTLAERLRCTQPTQMFALSYGTLTEETRRTLPAVEDTIHRIIVVEKFAASQKKMTKVKVGKIGGAMKMSQQYEWADGRPIFETSTSHMRRLQGSTDGIHKALRKWQVSTGWSANLRKVWKETWVPFRAAKENCFLWQILYRTPATEQWRHPTLTRLDAETHCTRCRRRRQEDILHCIWNCPNSLKVWKWVRSLLQEASGGSQQVELTCKQVLLADSLPSTIPVPKILWAILRVIRCWEIWKARCQHYMQNQRSSSRSIIRRIWHRLSIYLQLFWRRKKVKMRSKKLTRSKARNQMQKEFGRSRLIWKLVGMELHTTAAPPRLT
jgi:hypothetical protein